ncbi:hypothetical protein [Streptomyces variabilis]
MANEGRSITVTVKYGGDQEDSWAVFRGAAYEVYDDIVTFFGLDSKSVTNLSLNELVIEAAQLAQSSTRIVRGLDARIVPQPPERADAARNTAGAAPPTASGASSAVLEQIAACKSVNELRQLWATNQAAFADQAVMDAWKARGRALKNS